MCSSGIKSPKVADSMSLGHALSVEYKRNVVLVIDLNFVVLREVDSFCFCCSKVFSTQHVATYCHEGNQSGGSEKSL